MPHATRRDSSASRVSSWQPSDNKMATRTSMEKFPDIDLSYQHGLQGNDLTQQSEYLYPPPDDRWQPRRDNGPASSSWWQTTTSTGTKGHTRQKSLTDAFRTIRTRKGSVNANIHEISDALKAPVSPKLIVRLPKRVRYVIHANDL
jgi:solute carrier family 35 protein E1